MQKLSGRTRGPFEPKSRNGPGLTDNRWWRKKRERKRISKLNLKIQSPLFSSAQSMSTWLLPWNQTCPPREGERTEEYCREENSIVSNILPIQCSYLIRPIASSMANTSASMVSCFCFSSTCSCTCIMYPLFFSCFVSFWVYENIFAAGSGGCAEQLGEDQAAIGVFLWPELAAGSLTQKIGNRSSSLRVSLFF